MSSPRRRRGPPTAGAAADELAPSARSLGAQAGARRAHGCGVDHRRCSVRVPAAGGQRGGRRRRHDAWIATALANGAGLLDAVAQGAALGCRGGAGPRPDPRPGRGAGHRGGRAGHRLRVSVTAGAGRREAADLWSRPEQGPGDRDRRRGGGHAPSSAIMNRSSSPSRTPVVSLVDLGAVVLDHLVGVEYVAPDLVAPIRLDVPAGMRAASLPARRSAARGAGLQHSHRRALFWCWKRSFWLWTMMPVGRCVRRTAESVSLTCWSPALSGTCRCAGRPPACCRSRRRPRPRAAPRRARTSCAGAPGIEGADAHEPVDAPLGAQEAVGAALVDVDGGALDAAPSPSSWSITSIRNRWRSAHRGHPESICAQSVASVPPAPALMEITVFDGS